MKYVKRLLVGIIFLSVVILIGASFIKALILFKPYSLIGLLVLPFLWLAYVLGEMGEREYHRKKRGKEPK